MVFRLWPRSRAPPPVGNASPTSKYAPLSPRSARHRRLKLRLAQYQKNFRCCRIMLYEQIARELLL